MTVPVIVQLPAHAGAAEPTRAITVLREAVEIADRHGVDAVLIPHAEGPGLDPTVLGGLLSAEPLSIPILVEAHTGRHAPYNLARRVQTLARITGGRAGLYLRDTGVDPVTAAGRPGAAGTGVLDEYVTVLRRLWDSFPESALLGDRDAGLFADVAQITPARHRGDVYDVAGALNVPIAPEQRPVLIADAESLSDADLVDAVITRETTESGSLPAYRPLTWGADAEDIAAHPAGVLLRIDGSASEFALLLDAALTELRQTRAETSAATGSALWRRRTPATTAA